ncbi:MAG: polysaccharide deacetylase [Bacteroidota bacterium]|nr:polysaccharide deacetylase [Bacteroidota bacterium]
MRRGLLTSLILILLTLCGSTQTISNYTTYYAQATLKNQNKLLFVLRRFVQNNNVVYLTVDPDNLAVTLVPGRKLAVKPDSLKGLIKAHPLCNYSKAWHKALGSCKSLQDAGISHTIPDRHGIILTIDLCPSEKPLDRALFLDIMQQMSDIEKPVPLAISISGHWLLKHPDDVNWLQSLNSQKKIVITWVNHSFNHYYNKNLPLALNFMLMKGTNVDQEVLLNEKTMIEHDLIPSIFFRFPGLVSDPRVFDKVMGFGLIPVGSDAWLAKGENASDGNIVLVHANGNEPLGIRKFIELLHRNETNIRNGQWKLFGLRESVVKEVDIQNQVANTNR